MTKATTTIKSLAGNHMGADLAQANLRGANLMGANLTRTNLVEADLRGANHMGADLARAYLAGAELREAELTPIREDFRKVLDAAPKEALGLRAALVHGNVDGSAYSGTCACLVGTIANVRGCDYRKLVTVEPDASRPAERWFLAIKPGDNRRNNQVVALTLSWLDEWLKEKGIAVPKRPKSIGEVARLMAEMTPAQRRQMLAVARAEVRS